MKFEVNSNRHISIHTFESQLSKPSTDLILRPDT